MGKDVTILRNYIEGTKSGERGARKAKDIGKATEKRLHEAGTGKRKVEELHKM